MNSTATSSVASTTTLSPAQLKALAVTAYWNHQFQVLQIMYTVSYGIMFFLAVALLVYLRRNRSTAYKGDSDAARKAILPSFEPLFWIMSVVTGALFGYFLVAGSMAYVRPVSLPWFTETMSQARQFTFFLVAAFLLQKSVSRPALLRSVAISLVICVTPILAIYIMTETKAPTTTNFIVATSLRAFDTLWFVWMLLRPVSRASARTQREFAAFCLVYYIGSYIYAILNLKQRFEDGATVIFCTVIWASFAPFFVYRLLRADTEFWRGVSDRACDFQQHFREAQGMQEIVSSQGLHILLEMHRKDLIDFSRLELQSKLGVGASANVFRGKIDSSVQVAVKAYSPSEISQETILEFSQEAALCSVLKHPNIVLFYGMCICPPSICLVYELCRGSLEDVLNRPRNSYVEPLWPKLCYMLDAARAVAYLHSFSPPFIHRDIKPANFLLDPMNIVKLTDFGESRSMAVKMTEVESKERKMTVRGTADYMAPEVIEGKAGQAVYTETADIYSLAITLWDILHPGQEKYPVSSGNHFKVFDMVLDGQRPPIDPEVPQMLHDLLENAWNTEAAFRPSAKMIVAMLEDMLEDICGQVVHRIADSVAYLGVSKTKRVAANNTPVCSGEELVRCLMDHEYAFEVEEAIRFGNSLMDAGCLHHSKHCQPFDNLASSTYFFDNHQLDLNQPLHEKLSILGTTPEEHSSYAATSMAGDGGNTLCDCRKLGQGHSRPKMPRKKMFGRRRKDENILTVNLLNDNGGDHDFGEFTTTSTTSSSVQRSLSTQLA
ncbi:hypothetical protein LEN26_016074 [Aphanomyces euteiches]|nr:hypothetical protein LEN26_016074 [Aphanomyces euteiches]KAH9126890.1 hypothetical protein AeMF1_002664 [Aphanomyces euteiches]KAH9191346.1 hypothetical protein AeNC1_006675 [Aphanomyces euteiches]